MKKQKGRIVTVELPYATNVLMQELASIANVGLRLITTGDTERLRPMETKDVLSEEEADNAALQPMAPINLPEPFEEERIEKEVVAPVDAVSAAAMGSSPASTVPIDESIVEGAEALQIKGAEQGDVALIAQGQAVEQEGVPAPITPIPLIAPTNAPVAPVQASTNAPPPIAQPIVQSLVPANPSNDLVVQVNKQDGGMTLSIQQPQTRTFTALSQGRRANMAPQNTVVYPSPAPTLPPTIAIQGGYQPSYPILSIDTSTDAMIADGLMPMMQSNPRQRVNRGPLQLPFAMPQAQAQGQGGSSSGQITVNKLG